MTAEEYLNSEPDSAGVATTFGYNDPQDNGVGFWGTNTNNPDVVGVSLSRSALAKHFGPDYEKTAYGKPVQVTNPNTGQSIVAPIVDIGPAKWVEDRQGSTIDLTHAANKALGGTGKTPMEWKVGLNADDFLDGADQSQAGKGKSADDFLAGKGEPVMQSIGKGHSADDFLAGTSEISAATEPAVPESVQQRQGAGYGAVLGPAMSGQANLLNQQSAERTAQQPDQATVQEKAPVPPTDLPVTPSIGPDQAPAMPQGPAPGERTTSAFGRMAGIPALPEATATNDQSAARAYDEARVAKESALAALQGFKGSLQGSSAALGEYVYKPVFHGIQSAIAALAPDTAVSKYTEGLYNDFNQSIEGTKKARADEAAQIPDTSLNRIAQAIGAMTADIGTAVVTSAAGKGLPIAAQAIGKAEAAAPTIFNIVRQEIPGLAKSAGTFAIPALRSGMDAQDMAQKMGASPADQSLAFWKAGLLTMSQAAIPMGVESNAAGMFQRFVERAVKSVSGWTRGHCGDRRHR